MFNVNHLLLCYVVEMLAVSAALAQQGSSTNPRSGHRNFGIQVWQMLRTGSIHIPWLSTGCYSCRVVREHLHAIEPGIYTTSTSTALSSTRCVCSNLPEQDLQQTGCSTAVLPIAAQPSSGTIRAVHALRLRSRKAPSLEEQLLTWCDLDHHRSPSSIFM